MTSSGARLCIDATLHIIERELGMRVAQETARIIEYTGARDANRQELPAIVAAAASPEAT